MTAYEEPPRVHKLGPHPKMSHALHVLSWAPTVEAVHSRQFNLSGSIPSSLGNIHNIQALYLLDNRINIRILDIFGSLKYLSILDLFKKRLTGHDTTSIIRLGKLTPLDIHGNLLSGSIPPSIGNYVL